MAFVEPVTLSARGVALVPLSLAHEHGLRMAAADGKLWQLRITTVPEPQHTRPYIEEALAQVAAATGFADQAHLTRVFKRIHGAPPGALIKAPLRRDAD